MDGGKFQRYVWVNGVRKRQRNREKYEETKQRFLENEVEEVESAKKAKVVWPGEFENQLKKRDQNLSKLEELENGSRTPAIHTPSDSFSLTSEDQDPEKFLEADADADDKKKGKVEKVSKKKVENRERREFDIPQDSGHYLDEFLDSPKMLNPSKTGGNFLLVSSSLVNE